MEFDDSSSAAARPARRAMDVVGTQGGRGVAQQWAQVLVLVGLHALAMLGFFALGVIDLDTLGVLAAMIAGGSVVFYVALHTGKQQKLRQRHVKLAVVCTAFAGMLVLFYLAPVT